MTRFLATVSVFLLSGCATIVNDGIHPVTISSVPPAEYSITNKYGMEVSRGTTPETVQLLGKDGYFKGADYTVRFSKEGYKDSIAPINSELSGWYFGNIVFGGLIGFLLVDPISGNMWDLQPGVGVTLNKEKF